MAEGKTPEQDLSDFNVAIRKAQTRPLKIHHNIEYHVTNGRTKPDFLDSYFEQAHKAATFGELAVALQEAVSSLRGVGIYNKICVNVLDMPPHMRDRFKDECIVSVDLDEKKWYTASLGAYMTRDGPEFKTEGSLRNVGGRGESVFGRVSTTTELFNSFTFSLGMTKPVRVPFLGGNGVLHVMAHNSIYDSMQYSNYTQKVTGGNVRFDFMPHSFTYDAAWRNTTLGADPSAELLRNGGESLKSSVRYTYSRDWRDNVTFPTTGHAYHISSELAGLGGDVKYLRNEFSYNINYPIPKTGVAFNYVLKGGLVAPLFGDTNRICDRFFLGGLGGTLSLRGFKLRGIDTGNAREAHGGDLYYTTAAHLTFPLPFLSHIPFVRAHVFANAGNLVLVRNGQYREAAQDMKDRARSAVGGGIIFTTPFGGRFEFNYCHPLRAFTGDKITKGFQFGIAISI